jgi:putative flippase GtrA
MSRTPLAFLIGGGLNTAFSYGVYLLLVRFLDYQAAYLIAYIAGIFSSYWINSVFVFRTPMSLSGLLRFPLVYVFQYVASALLLWLLVKQFGMNQTFAPLLVTGTLLPFTFLLSRFILRQDSARPHG